MTFTVFGVTLSTEKGATLEELFSPKKIADTEFERGAAKLPEQRGCRNSGEARLGEADILGGLAIGNPNVITVTIRYNRNLVAKTCH